MLTTTARCPRCELERGDDATECARCGVVFRKWEDAEEQASRVTIVEPATEQSAEPAFGRTEAKMLGLALAMAGVANALPFVSAVLGALATLFHESGHAAASWLLGHPAIPAFDLVYGGGFTHEDNFQPVLAVLIGAGWLTLMARYRRHPGALVIIGVASALWLFTVSSEWRREIVIAGMGHGGELILGSTFLFMALAGVGWRRPEVERSLGAFLGCFVLIHTMGFAWKLGHDSEFLSWYLQGKGGALMNDLEAVALDLHIHTGIHIRVEAAAGWLLFAALAALPITVVAVIQRDRLRTGLESLLETR